MSNENLVNIRLDEETGDKEFWTLVGRATGGSMRDAIKDALKAQRVQIEHIFAPATSAEGTQDNG